MMLVKGFFKIKKKLSFLKFDFLLHLNVRIYIFK